MSPKQYVLKCAEMFQEAYGIQAREVLAFADTLPDDGVWVPKAFVDNALSLCPYDMRDALRKDLLAAAPKGDSNG